MAYQRKVSNTLTDKDSVGYCIRKYRMMRNMTAKELAEKLGVAENQVTAVERGVWTPKLVKREEIAKILDIPLYLLLVDVDLGLDRELNVPLIFLSDYSTKDLLEELERRCGDGG